jgi:hypothetical protein
MKIKEKDGNDLFSKPCDFSIDNRPLIINKSKIIEILEDAQKTNDIHTLRPIIQTLRGNVNNLQEDQVGVLNITSNGDTIKLTKKYLVEQLDKILNSNTHERSQYYIERLLKSLTTIKTGKINDLNLNKWQEYEDIITDSLWIMNRRDSSGVHTAGYWGNFIPQIPNQLLKRYTKKGDWVLDTFLGCGTTLIECQRLGRNGIGVELQEHVASKARELIQLESNKHNVILDVVQGDSSTIDYKMLLDKHKQKKIQLLIMHPPYHDIIKFSKDPRDLSNARSVDTFLEMFSSIVRKSAEVLEKGRYLAIVIGDKYSKGEWVPLGFLTMNEILKMGFSLKSVIVKNFEDTLGKRNQKELWRYRALVGGFYIFKHEYIILFKKK